MVADREVRVRITADIDVFKRRLAEAAVTTVTLGRATDSLGRNLGDVESQAKRTDTSINQLTGRLRLFADAALILGPALAPLGAAGVAGIVAMSAQLGSLAGAMGVTLLAVNGLGDGLKALDAYQLDPTTENLAKLRAEMEKLGPAGANFVHFLDEIQPELKKLQMAARSGLLPGAEEGIDALLERLPELRRLIRGMAEVMGDQLADAGAALGGEKFDDFFLYLKREGIPILDDTGRTIGNLAEAAANLFVAFGPLSGDISGGILEWSQGVAEASRDLDENQGFQEFVAFIRETGPQVLDTLVALANALLQIVEATAPLGGPVLVALEGVAKALAVIADSDLGTPIFGALAALALYNRAIATTAALNSTAWGGKAIAGMKSYTTGLYAVTTAQERAQMTATQLDAANRTNWGGMAKGAGQVGLLAFALSGLAEETGLSNAAMLSIAGPWGAAAGLAIDLMHATDGLESSLTAMNAAMDSTDASQVVAALDQANAELERVQANTVLGTSLLGDQLGGFVNAIAPLSNVANTMGLITGKTEETADTAAELKRHLDELRNGTYQATGTLGDFSRVLEENAESAQEEAQALDDATQAMRDHRMEVLRALNAELNYQQAIDDARKALKENGKTVDETTEKGRDNLRNLYALAEGWNGQSDAAKNATGSLRAAQKNFIETATAMGMAEGKAKRLADRLFEIPPKRATQITTPGMDEASNKARTLKQILDSIKSKDINIAVHYQMLGNKPNAPLPGDPNSDRVGGGRISGRGDVSPLSPREVYTSGRSDAEAKAQMSLYGLADAATRVGGRLESLRDKLEKAERVLDRERQARDDLIQASKAFAEAVGQAFSKADPFEGGLSQFDAATAANTNDSAAAQAALAAAAAQGLDGPLYQALAASGNLMLLQEFAMLSAAEIAQREQAFANQSAAQAGLGGAAADQVFAEAIKDQNKELREAQKERRQLMQAVKHLEDRLPDKVEDGARRGIAERDRRTQSRVRTG